MLPSLRLAHGNGRLMAQRAQQFQYRQYTKTRDMKRIYANEPSRSTKYCASLMATLTHIDRTSPRQVGRRTKHVFD